MSELAVLPVSPARRAWWAEAEGDPLEVLIVGLVNKDVQKRDWWMCVCILLPNPNNEPRCRAIDTTEIFPGSLYEDRNCAVESMKAIAALVRGRG